MVSLLMQVSATVASKLFANGIFQQYQPDDSSH